MSETTPEGLCTACSATQYCAEHQPMSETTPIQSSRLRNRVHKVRLGRKTLLFRRGNFSHRRFWPFVEHGLFGCWVASWRWGQVGWELTRLL